jgi:hypothetical protein
MNTFRTLKSELMTSLKELRVKPIKEIDVPKGKQLVRVLNQGVQEEWIVPKDIGLILNNFNGTALQSIDRVLGGSSLVAKIFRAPASATRALAVTKNPLFIYLRNPVRDIQTASMYAGNIAKDWVGAFKEAILGNRNIKSEAYRMAEKYNAFLGTIMQEVKEPEQIVEQLMKKAGIFGTEVGAKKFTDRGLFKAITLAMEEATRVAVFKRGLRQGLSPDKAALFSRTATVDFSKAGTLVQVLNKVIPFLNPAMQGTINTARLIGKDPVQFYRRAFILGAVPAMTLNAWNAQHESYFNIPRSTRLRNWIIMIGEEDGRDFKGRPIKVPIYVTIPKGEMQMWIAGITERALNLSREEFPEKTNEFLGRLIENANPVGSNTLLLPEGFKQAVELKSNYSFFRDSQIEPDWVKIDGKWRKTNEVPSEYRTKEGTTHVARVLGKALGWSPIKIDHVIRTGLANDILRLLDIPIRQTEDNQLFNKEDKNSDLLDMTKLPLLNGILRSSEAGDFEARKKYEETETIKKTKEQIDRRRERIKAGEERTKK